MARDSFEQTQTHRGRGVLARAESRFGWNDDARGAATARFFGRTQNQEA